MTSQPQTPPIRRDKLSWKRGQAIETKYEQRRKYPRHKVPKGLLVGWKSGGQRKVSRAETFGMGGIFIYTTTPPDRLARCSNCFSICRAGKFAHARWFVRCGPAREWACSSFTCARRIAPGSIDFSAHVLRKLSNRPARSAEAEEDGRRGRRSQTAAVFESGGGVRNPSHPLETG